MHVLAIAEDILEAALGEAEKHHAQTIKAINVKIEDSHFTEADSLKFCLEAVANWTIADGARIDIELADSNNGGDSEISPHITLELD